MSILYRYYLIRHGERDERLYGVLSVFHGEKGDKKVIDREKRGGASGCVERKGKKWDSGIDFK